MAVYVMLGLSLFVLLIGLALLIRSHRLIRLSKSQLSQRQNRGDEQTLWEVGRPLRDQGANSTSHLLKRRGFLSRFAVGLLGAFTAHQAARGGTVAGAEGFLTSRQLRDRLENDEFQNSHIDVPGPGGSYADIPARHSDSPHHDSPPHSDTPHHDTPPAHHDTPPAHHDTPPSHHQDTPHVDH